LTFTATVYGFFGRPGTDVTFLDGTTVLANVALDTNQQASFSSGNLSSGMHTMTAEYNGLSDGVFITITPAPLTITANNVSKTYGDSVTFAGTEFSSNGLINGDKVTRVTLSSAGAGATASVAGSPYPIIPSAAVGAGVGNYLISYVNAGLTVNPRALTVTVDNQTKITGEANPAFTASYTGFVLGQGPSVLGGIPTFTTPATTTSPPGAYAITPGGLTSSNYAITFVKGILTVLSYTDATTTILKQVQGANVPSGIQNALVSSLQAAIDSFNRGNNTAGVNQLGAFQNKVSAQSGKAIDAALADALIAAAQRIINAVG
jgi:hypothetical protein